MSPFRTFQSCGSSSSLNLSFTNKENLVDIGILMSLMVPLGSLVVKITSFVAYTSTYEMNQARRDSWIQHQLGRSRAISVPQKQKKYIYVFVSSLMVLMGCSMFIYMVYSTVWVNQTCQTALGQPLWEGAYPRRVFSDGVLTFTVNVLRCSTHGRTT